MINKLLEENGIQIINSKKIRDAHIISVKSKFKIAFIYSNNNIFSIKRDVFNYISESENYSFCLINKKENKLYYLDFKTPNNWIKTSFERCKKDEIYFGKIILQHRDTIDGVIKKLKDKI